MVLGVRAPLLVSGSRDERIATITAHQRGRASRQQLTDAGISDAAIGRAVARGALHLVRPRVYAAGHPAAGPLTAETEALLACGPDAILSHVTAAALWKLIAPRAPQMIDVTVPGDRVTRRRGIAVHRSHTLQPRDIRIHQGLPITSPARALLDSAETLTIPQLEQAVEEGICNHIVRPNQIQDALKRAHGRKGAPLLAEVIRRRTRTGSKHTRSHPERQFLALIRKAGLPEPELNVPLHGFVADALWRQQRVVFEIDSYGYHSTRAKMNRDRRKDRVYKQAGLDPNRITDDQLEHEPYAVVAQVAEALVRAGLP